MKTALLIVDVQNDFCPGGGQRTARGDEVATRIAELIADPDGQDREYQCVVATQDWHIDPGAHFSEAPDFVDSWPKHCVAGSKGAQIRRPVPTDQIDQFFKKGHYTAAYSGFEGVNDADQGLADWLREQEITHLLVARAGDHTPRGVRHCYRPLRASHRPRRAQGGLRGARTAGHVLACRRRTRRRRPPRNAERRRGAGLDRRQQNRPSAGTDGRKFAWCAELNGWPAASAAP